MEAGGEAGRAATAGQAGVDASGCPARADRRAGVDNAVCEGQERQPEETASEGARITGRLRTLPSLGDQCIAVNCCDVLAV